MTIINSPITGTVTQYNTDTEQGIILAETKELKQPIHFSRERFLNNLYYDESLTIKEGDTLRFTLIEENGEYIADTLIENQSR